MSKFVAPRVSRVAVGMAVLGAFAMVPFAAQAADTNATGNFPADSGAAANLAVVIPGNAAVGAYSDTLTFTAAPGRSP
jgi:hypothetical protein